MIRRITGMFALAAVSAAGIVGCAAPEEPRHVNGPLPEVVGEPVPILDTWTGQQSERDEAGLVAIRDQPAWERAWSATGHPGDPPEVDFEEHMVVGAWMGQRPTGGHAIRIQEIREQEDHLAVAVEARDPDPGEPVTQALTAPYQLVLVPHSGKPLQPVAEDEPLP